MIYITHLVVCLVFYAFRVFGLSTSDNYVRVERKMLSSFPVISLYPQSWIAKAVKSQYRGCYIKEVVYFPNTITPIITADDSNHAIDDDHWCSLLADHGIIVHIPILPSAPSKNEYNAMVRETINWRISKMPARNLAVVCHELSCCRFLGYLADVALPMSSQARADIGAVICIDPPPLPLMRAFGDNIGCELILQSRYNNIWHDDVDDRQKSFKRRMKTDQPDIFELLESIQTSKRSLELPFLESFNTQDEAPQGDDESWRAEIDQFELDQISAADPFLRHSKQKEQLMAIKYNIAPQTQVPALRSKLTAQQLVGGLPTKFSEVGDALKNRILIINTISEFSNKEWGQSNCEEVSALYDAGNVISFKEESSESRLNSARTMVIEGDDDDDDIWTDDAKYRHQFLSNVIGDWFSLLSQFEYI